MAKSRDPKELRDVWEGWHTISPPMRKDYPRFVELANKGARELGFADTGAMWRSKYDMPADEFTKEVDRLWEQVRPLYVSLHAYVRMKLHEKYGDVVPEHGPIPAHLLGNIWAQDWTNVFDLVTPANADPGYSLTKILEARKFDAIEMVKMGERFYTSLGFAPLPQTFWERSLLVKPRDRDVVCHASAWDIDTRTTCASRCASIRPKRTSRRSTTSSATTTTSAPTRTLPVIFRDSANQAFHEAIGDTIALSVTPEYLVKIGLLDKAPDASRDIGLLMSRALEKVAFLPFGLVIDQWRWKVFSGAATPADYNKAWWELRLKYQGIAPPSPRGEEFFDPGAKYHVPANYAVHALLPRAHPAVPVPPRAVEGRRLHDAAPPLLDLREQGGGRRLDAMLKMGQSKPWPDALEAMTGSRQMDATAIVDYFAPLKAWLDEQMKGKPVGW